MKAEGQDVVGFGAGEPDFDTPQHIKDACRQGARRRLHQIHARRRHPRAAPGHRRQAQARERPHLQALADHRLLRRQALLLQRHLRHLPGRRRGHHPRALLAELSRRWSSWPAPSPSSSRPRTRPSSRSRPTQLRAAITPRTRLFVLNSPSNPTGSVYTPDETQGPRRHLRREGRAHHERRDLRAPALRRRDHQERGQLLARRTSSTRSSCTASPRPGA